jgi:hypothetical protein
MAGKSGSGQVHSGTRTMSGSMKAAAAKLGMGKFGRDEMLPAPAGRRLEDQIRKGAEQLRDVVRKSGKR